MKKSIFLVVVIVMLSSVTGFAQAQIGSPRVVADSSKCRFERFEAHKMEVIDKELQLSPKVNKDFKEIYAKYRKELMGSIEKLQPNSLKGAELTDQEHLERITVRFENISIASKIKAQYVDDFAEVLTPKQIMKLYTLEGEMGRRLKGAADRCTQKRGECKRGAEGAERRGEHRKGGCGLK